MTHFRSHSSKPAFIVGVTGDPDLDRRQSGCVKAALKHVFSWLRASPKEKDKELGHPGLGLADTPIVLLTSLAPGANQWAAAVAEEISTEPKHRAGIHVIAPLPFSKDQYLRSSPFMGADVEEGERTFLAAFPDEETFIVRLTDELDLGEAELREKHQSILADPEKKADRARRFLAAEEYVVAYCDILLALTEESINQVQSAAVFQTEIPSAGVVARRKLGGSMVDLLPTSQALGGSDNGAIIHICAPRAPKANGGAPPTNPPNAGKMEMLFPYDCCPDNVQEQNYTDKRWQKAGYAALFDVTRKFQLLNTEEVNLRDEQQSKEFSGILDNATALRPTHETANKIGDLWETLDHLALLARRVSDCNRYYDSGIKRLKQTLFGLAFFSALFFSLAEGWTPTPDTGGGLRIVCFVAALLFTMTSWAVFKWRRANLHDQRSDDYRAIAEGLRVQFYWTACGSGESVASNYLQRQRGEVGWIRRVISAAAFPYEPMRSVFNSLSPDKRRSLLRDIQKGWVQEQLDYFTKNVGKLTRQHAFFVHYSSIMLLSAFFLYTLNFCFQNPAFCNFVFRNTSPIVTRSQGVTLCGAALIILAILYTLSNLDRIDRPRMGPRELTGKPANPLSQPIVDRVYGSLFLAFSMLLPERIASVRGGRYLLRGALSVAITMMAVGIAYYARGLGPWLPSPIKISTLLRNLLLAGGALCGLWVNANHFTENMRRYASMKSMFKGVDERYGEYLAASNGSNPEMVQRVFDDLRALIVAVGREALSENADWLFTHRARPVEPVSA
jgi:hypothetical protein